MRRPSAGLQITLTILLAFIRWLYFSLYLACMDTLLFPAQILLSLVTEINRSRIMGFLKEHILNLSTYCLIS